MAGRKRHSAEDIVRKLRRADELAAEGRTGEEIAAELNVSAATLYNLSSITGVHGQPDLAVYGATKAATAGSGGKR